MRYSAAVLALACLVSAGCGYTTRGLYPEDIQTVSVPIFQSDLLRRDVEFELTQKVIQRIERRTPFKVVDRGNADTELRGRISSFFKAPFGEDGFDNPRGGTMMLVLEVQWIDKRTGRVLNETNQNFQILTTKSFNIDFSQSIASATSEACDQMADHVVTLMQAPW